MYKIVYTNRMKKDAKLMKKRGKDMGVLMYQIYEDILILSATATGSHADLFGK